MNTRWVTHLFLIAAMVGCQVGDLAQGLSPGAEPNGTGGQLDGETSPSPTPPPAPRPPYVYAPPTDGEKWFFVGQDVDSIDNYALSVRTPEGVVGYTSLERLEGLDRYVDDGGGPNHLNSLAARYPSARISLGLYLIDYLDEVLSGEADENITRLAEFLRLYNRPVLLRIGYEFDAPWARYEPVDYRLAYRHIHEKLTSLGVTSTAFVWQSAACIDRFGAYPLEAWYPGDDVVDWVGISYFSPDFCAVALEEVMAFAKMKQKLVFVAEAAPRGFDLGELTFSESGNERVSLSVEEIWVQWFQKYFDFLAREAETVRATTYINADWDTQGLWGAPYLNGYWGDSRIQVQAAIQNRFQEQLRLGGFVSAP